MRGQGHRGWCPAVAGFRRQELPRGPRRRPSSKESRTRWKVGVVNFEQLRVEEHFNNIIILETLGFKNRIWTLESRILETQNLRGVHSFLLQEGFPKNLLTYPSLVWDPGKVPVGRSSLLVGRPDKATGLTGKVRGVLEVPDPVWRGGGKFLVRMMYVFKWRPEDV